MGRDGLRWMQYGLHTLFVALVALAIVRVAVDEREALAAVFGVAILFAVTYAAGTVTGTRLVSSIGTARWWWLGALSLEWLGLVGLTPEAAYLVFPLFFLYLHLLPRWPGPLAVIVSTAAAVVAIGEHGSYSVGGVVGPVVAATAAIAIAAGYRALARESASRQNLIDELVAAQEQLAASERERGILDERTRLAGEIHDTLAQGLSSIQMLLHAAERANPGGNGIEHVRLARSTAADNLAEARHLIRELRPPSLMSDTLIGALQRMGHDSSLDVEVNVTGQPRGAQMTIETHLLRIAQGALGNVEQHAQIGRARIDLDFNETSIRLCISDDGAGFEPETTRSSEAPDSFGFDLMRMRAQQLGGALHFTSAPGEGTIVTVEVPG